MTGDAQMGFQTAHRIGLAAVSILLLLLVLELVRRGLLKERYALLWLATAVFGLVIGIFPRIIVVLADVLNFQYLTVFFVLSFIFGLGLVLAFSIVVSRLVERNRRLTQEVALLSHTVKQLERRQKK
ncbi:MAG: DUF2304 domain-containing protein [Candidatus Hydrogenedentes bacterium]|nr:DUF2304 domain-containing protein [Candidatus Hydrogenedentota bacterium]